MEPHITQPSLERCLFILRERPGRATQDGGHPETELVVFYQNRSLDGGNVIIKMSVDRSNKGETAERGRKRTREGSSQTDEEDCLSEQDHMQGCRRCSDTTNSRLSGIEEKLNTLLTILPELETYKNRITLLEEENKSLQTSLENSQAEIEDLKTMLNDVNSKQEAANTSSERVERELKELHRRHVKLECHSRRSNMQFFGIVEREGETNSDTELALREFFRNKLKILRVDEEQIRFDRVHRVKARMQSNGRNPQPRPIIVKLTDFQDKVFIKSFIKNLPSGTGFGISDDFPKEVDDIRKKLYPILKAAKREKRAAYFNVEKLIIDGALYRGEETLQFPFYGRLMDG